MKHYTYARTVAHTPEHVDRFQDTAVYAVVEYGLWILLYVAAVVCL